MGVTNIKAVFNNTSHHILVDKYEAGPDKPGETTGGIPPNGIWSGSMWIPWANNWYEFKEHFMLIQTGHTISGFIFQQGDFVRYIEQEIEVGRYRQFLNPQYSYQGIFKENAPSINGIARVDGDRKLVVYTEGNKLKCRLENYR